MQTKEIFAIQYDNGEKHDDHWCGIIPEYGVFAERQVAENKIVELKEAHNKRIEDEIVEGYMTPFGEFETWTIVPIKYIY